MMFSEWELAFADHCLRLPFDMFIKFYDMMSLIAISETRRLEYFYEFY